jgi:pyranose oxidase
MSCSYETLDETLDQSYVFLGSIGPIVRIGQCSICSFGYYSPVCFVLAIEVPSLIIHSFPDVVSSTGGADGLPHNDLPAAPVVREVGGMGSYWSCATPEQHPMIERSDLFSHEEWSSLYGQARALFHTTDREFDHSLRHQLVKDTLSRAHKGREVANLPLACQRSTSNSEYVRWTGPATILGELANPTYNGGNFELKAQHRCTRLLLDSASKRIVGAELTDMLTNEVLLARAKRYIICAGAILTAGILFNSHIRSETGYPALVLPH